MRIICWRLDCAHWKWDIPFAMSCVDENVQLNGQASDSGRAGSNWSTRELEHLEHLSSAVFLGKNYFLPYFARRERVTLSHGLLNLAIESWHSLPWCPQRRFSTAGCKLARTTQGGLLILRAARRVMQGHSPWVWLVSRNFTVLTTSHFQSHQALVS